MNQTVRATGSWILGLVVLAALGVVLVSYFELHQARLPVPPRPYLHSDEAYIAHRKELIAAMKGHSFSGDVQLTAAETNADHFLRQVRSKETAVFKTAGNFPPSQFFFEARTNIENSRLFPIFKKM